MRQNGLGDGDTDHDWTRRRRDSGAPPFGTLRKGEWRVYTIELTCTDGNGNATWSAVTVTVPKSQKP
jgi:hypothetical protein